MKKITMSRSTAERISWLAAGLVILMTVMSLMTLPVRAEEESGTVIRVGCLDYEGFSRQNEDGTVTGYCVDYLNEMAKYDDFTIKYVFSDWKSLREMLLNHEIDLIYTRRNDELPYDYSEEQFVVTLTAIYARADDDDFYYDDYERLEGARVGFLKNSFHSDYFADYAKCRGFTYEPVLFETTEDMINTLKAGKIDAIGTDSMSDYEELKCVGSYGTEAMYLATWEGNSLMSRINYAINEVTSQEFDFSNTLFKKYFMSDKGLYDSTLTRAEAEFVKNCPTLKIAFATGARPMSYTDESTGEIVGITPELLRLIEEKTGLSFEYMPLSGRSSEYSYDYFRDNEIDLIAGVEVNEFNENTPGILLTRSYFSSTKCLVTRKGKSISVNDKNTVVAIVGGSATLPHVIAEKFPSFTILSCETIEECLEAVKNGRADVLLHNEYLIEQYLKRPQYESLTIVPQISLEENVAISPVSYQQETDPEKAALLSNPYLISVLNKAVSCISDQETDEIVLRYTVEKSSGISLQDTVYKFRYPLLGISILGVALVLVLLILISVKHRNLALVSEKNIQLSEAVKQADSASETKSRFLAQMSHEIRTPMNAIVGMTALAEKIEGNPERTSDYLRKIDLSSKMLLSIINDVLDMSAIESHKLKIASSPFDIKELLTSVTTVYYGQCREKGIEFTMTVADGVDEILVGDSLRLNQILMNLVSNACKFTESGGSVRVQVTAMGQNESQKFLRFIVSDTGCGMSEEMQTRLFHAFEQESAQTAKKHGGSGLGLAITKNLITLMHGNISVKSVPGEGTTFTVDLPFGISEEAWKPDASSLGRLTVLVADDDEDVRAYVADILTHMGVRFDLCSSGKEALECLKKRKEKGKIYDACIIDWRMPEMDGIELTKKIRELVRKQTLVIIISAYDVSEVSDEAMEAGADRFIAKPFFQSSLFNALISVKHEKYTEEKKIVTYDFAGKRVLLAEDFELNREVATDILSQAKLQVDCAENGSQALEMFEKSTPGTYDVILMDIQMPVMDGFEATRRIRAGVHPQAKSIPIFAMTANAFAEDVTASLSAGMNGHISKPIDTGRLFEMLGKVFEK